MQRHEREGRDKKGTGDREQGVDWLQRCAGIVSGWRLVCYFAPSLGLMRCCSVLMAAWHVGQNTSTRRAGGQVEALLSVASVVSAPKYGGHSGPQARSAGPSAAACSAAAMAAASWPTRSASARPIR